MLTLCYSIMKNRSDVTYEFPTALTRFKYYEFSFYYHIVRDNRDPTTSLTFSFIPSFVHNPWQMFGGLNIAAGPKTYTRANTTFMYTSDQDRTWLYLGLSSSSRKLF